MAAGSLHEIWTEIEVRIVSKPFCLLHVEQFITLSFRNLSEYSDPSGLAIARVWVTL